MNKPLLEMPDVNVLVALVDEKHIHNLQANEWFEEASQQGWAVCPLNLAGAMRVLARPNQPYFLSLLEARDVLDALIQEYFYTFHFWLDNISPLDESLFDVSKLQGYRQLSDLHLPGIAHRNGGTFVTFDGGLSNTLAAVRNPSPQLLRVLVS